MPSARDFLSLVVFAHTVFALPFALLSAVLAAGGVPDGRTLLWILVAMVGARSAAMSFNRIVDRRIDAKNPRTARSEIPAGVVSPAAAALFCAGSAALFVLAAAQLNRLCLVLSPVALAIVLGYSYAKRVTPFAHLFLGLALAIAPVGAWVAVTGAFALPPVLLGFAVLFWVAGFDVIYSLQDEEFDRAEGLRSIPARFGAARALQIARLFHGATLVLLYAVFLAVSGGWLFGAAVVVAGLFLVRQHRLVSPGDLSRVDAAFFTANGWLSVAVFVLGAADVLLR
ncbi:MAG: UbiA family prenyltransferase [Holophagales bacterium]|nr:UbiA family prenyltransferase [Holophagales bacterium]